MSSSKTIKISDLSDVFIENNNTICFCNAIFYYIENQPTEVGNYWHYVNGVVAEW